MNKGLFNTSWLKCTTIRECLENYPNKILNSEPEITLQWYSKEWYGIWLIKQSADTDCQYASEWLRLTDEDKIISPMFIYKTLFWVCLNFSFVGHRLSGCAHGLTWSCTVVHRVISTKFSYRFPTDCSNFVFWITVICVVGRQNLFFMTLNSTFDSAILEISTARCHRCNFLCL